MDRVRWLIGLSLTVAAGCSEPAVVHGSSASSSEPESTIAPEEEERCGSGWTCQADETVCVDGRCVPPGPCDDPGDCDSPQVCVREQCVAPGPCDDGGDCGPGEICEQEVCTPAAEVPACDTTGNAQALFSVAHASQGTVSAQFRNADGDAAHELDLGLGSTIVEIRGGTTTAQPLLATEGDVQLLRAADLDEDGVDELLIAQPTLWILNGSTSAVTAWSSFQSAPLRDLAVGSIPGRGLYDASALWACPYRQGCGSEWEIAEFDATADGTLSFSSNHTIAEPMLALDIGRLDESPNTLVVDTVGALVVFGSASFALPVEDTAVEGAGVLTIGDLDATGFEEIVRLSPDESQTVASLYSSDGLTLAADFRGRFAGELRMVRIGDLDGDTWPDVVMAGTDHLVLWLGPARAGEAHGCAIEVTPPHDIIALAVGDADGDAKDEIAIVDGAEATVLTLNLDSR